MEEFEKSVGHSPIVKELIRRGREKNDESNKPAGANYLRSKSLRMSKKTGADLLKNIKGVASGFKGERERSQSAKEPTPPADLPPSAPQPANTDPNQKQTASSPFAGTLSILLPYLHISLNATFEKAKGVRLREKREGERDDGDDREEGVWRRKRESNAGDDGGNASGGLRESDIGDSGGNAYEGGRKRVPAAGEKGMRLEGEERVMPVTEESRVGREKKSRGGRERESEGKFDD